ncbi:hypothetical protein GUJ93_ZPchr0003g18531 [Zizania palustris]|uniref:Uncharacterized protein n=1 Tax=Zizania palustris TaxID=103762 RepID=A0A8J5SE22_ZIZPA|nr:hypothetical protein GUJ93_ZPchr0003g18531 [Zizania palustris]
MDGIPCSMELLTQGRRDDTHVRSHRTPNRDETATDPLIALYRNYLMSRLSRFCFSGWRPATTELLETSLWIPSRSSPGSSSEGP